MFRNLLLPLVVVERNPSNLAPGSYNGVVSFAAPPPANSPTTGETIDIPVTLGVTAVQKKILLSQTGLTFTAVVGGDIAPETISVANDGQGVMNFTVRASALSGDYWLSVSPDSGSADAAGAAANLDARIDASRLSPGLYTGQLRVEAPDADNSPQFVTVFLNVLPTNSNPGPTVQPSTLRFTGVAGGAARKDQPAKLIVQPSIAGLTPGVRSGALNITTLRWLGADDRHPARSDRWGASAQSSKSHQAGAEGCSPSRLLPAFTFSVTRFHRDGGMAGVPPSNTFRLKI